MQVGIVEYELEEFAIFVGQALVDFLLFVVALFALLQNEDDDCKGQAHNRDDVTEKFEGFEERHGGKERCRYTGMTRASSSPAACLRLGRRSFQLTG